MLGTPDRPFVVFDVETTGTNPDTDRIIELGVVKLVGGETVDSKSKRFNPGVPIPADATKVHGIKDSDVADCPSFGQAAASIYAYMTGVDLGGYNVARFDVPILSKEFARHKLVWPAEGQVVIDALRIWRMQEQLYTLEHACKRFDVQNIKAHGALSDSVATAAVIRRQANEWKASTLDDLRNLGRDPSWVDEDGRLAKDASGNVRITFGKHKGKRLGEVPKDYIDWLLRQEFPQEFKRLVSGGR